MRATQHLGHDADLVYAARFRTKWAAPYATCNLVQLARFRIPCANIPHGADGSFRCLQALRLRSGGAAFPRSASCLFMWLNTEALPSNHGSLQLISRERLLLYHISNFHPQELYICLSDSDWCKEDAKLLLLLVKQLTQGR